MPKFLYVAKSFKGEDKKGVLEAKDIHQLSQKLREQGFVLVKARSETQKKGFKISLPVGKVPITEKMFFIRNLQVMTNAGLSLPRAIGSLSKQVKNEKFKKALVHIREEITKGRPLSSALGDHPDIFPELFQSMISVGEESGTLNKVLQTLSLQMEKEHTLKSKIQGALAYPTIIILAMLGVGALMLVTVIPQLAETFIELEIELPPATQMIIGFANFLIDSWYLAVGLLLFFIILAPQLMKQEDVKKIVDKIILKIPVLSKIIKEMNAAYMLRTLSSLIAAGTSLPRSLEITSGTLDNFYFKKSMIEAAKKVRKGEKLSDALEPYRNVYPLIVIQMISVGEETGETSGILSKLADFFEEEVANTTKNLTSIIEPIIMLMIGGAIGFFAVSMIQPMYSMLGSV